MSELPAGDEVLAIRAPFEPRSHLEWVMPPKTVRARRYLALLLDAVAESFAGSALTTDIRDPCWRLQLWEGTSLLVSSYQFRD